MFNKRVLSKIKMGKSVRPNPYKKDIIVDPMGQWNHPGKNTRIPSDRITMKGVNYPVLGVSNTGQKQMMQPGREYNFPGADYVDEYPQMKKGGLPKAQKGGDPPKIWVKSADDPRYKDYLIRQALYNYSNNPNFTLRSDAEYDIYDSILNNNFDKFGNDYYSNLLKGLEEQKKSYVPNVNDVNTEYYNTYYKQIFEDPNYGPYGSKVTYETIPNAQIANQPDINTQLLMDKEINPFLTQYPPEKWEKQTSYSGGPFNYYYNTNLNTPFGSRNHWKKPDTLLIEDKINRANLKNIYPNLSEEDIQKVYQRMSTEPDFISNIYNPNWNGYVHALAHDYVNNKYTYLADPKKTTFTDTRGLTGYLPDEIKDRIIQEYEYTPIWSKPEQAYGVIPDPIIIGPPPKLENSSNLTLRPAPELEEHIDAPQYTLEPYTAERPYLDVKLPQNKIKKLFDSGVLANKGHIDLGVKNKTRLIPRIVQKVTGYDPAYFEGYEDEEGKYVPGELDYGNETGSQIEFKGAASLQDLINQQKYAKEYEEYEKKLDEKFERSKKKQVEGQAFKKGGAKKKFTSDIINSTNYLFAEHPLFKKKKQSKKRIYSPNAKYYQDGGELPEASYGYSVGNLIRKDDGGERKKRKTRWKNVTDESFFPHTTKTPIDPRYLQKYPDFQPDILNMPEVALTPRRQPSFLENTEDTVNEWLGYPMQKAAREAAQRGGKEDPVDNFRHPMAGYYTAQKIGPLGANALGILHEISTLSDPRDTRPWYNKLRESAEDIYNNNEGASLSFLPESWAKSIIGFESDNNLLPDGVSNPRGKNMYFKKLGGNINYQLGDEVDEATMRRLKKLGYTFEKL